MAFRLPRLPDTQPAWITFKTYWQKTIEKIESHEATQNQLIQDLQTQVDALTGVRRSDAVSASFTIPTLVATAVDAGANATITIANHTRQYGDSTSVSVTGAALTAQPYSTVIAIYYDDINRAGGAVTFHATTDLKTAQNNYIVGRHYVATVTTPASGGAATSGGTPPPGSGYGSSGGGGIVLP